MGLIGVNWAHPPSNRRTLEGVAPLRQSAEHSSSATDSETLGNDSETLPCPNFPPSPSRRAARRESRSVGRGPSHCRRSSRCGNRPTTVGGGLHHPAGESTGRPGSLCPALLLPTGGGGAVTSSTGARGGNAVRVRYACNRRQCSNAAAALARSLSIRANIFKKIMSARFAR
eukprot:SAG31_NODE_9418_length_1281_cov_1.192893_1_plen_172_part_00